MVVKFNEVETDKLTANEYKKHLLVKYNDQPCFIQNDWMKLDHYGVPKIDKYHTTEESRRYIKLSLSNPDFTEFILKLDDYFSSDKFKSKNLTEKQQSFTYIPIYKQGNENYTSSIKLKINVDENGHILSEIFHKNGDEMGKCVVNNMDDVKQCFPYNCLYRVVFKVSKIWFMSKTCGVQLKLIKAQIETNNKQVNEVDFCDSE